MFGLDNILGAFNNPAEATRKQYQGRVDAINKLEPKMKALSDEQLAAKTEEVRTFRE